MSTLLLRIASVVYLLFTAGHTFGAMFKDPKQGGPEKQAVLMAMRTYHENVMGTSRSYWDFYRGFGFYVSCALLLLAILCWQLGSLARTTPSAARPLIWTLFIISIPMTILSFTNFFAAPALFATLATLLLGAAAFTVR